MFRLLVVVAIIVCVVLGTQNDQTAFHQIFESNSEQADRSTIEFYYDHSNAPKWATENDILQAAQDASNLWQSACGIKFKFIGDRYGDFVNGDNPADDDPGIIKWDDTLDGDAVGQAHLGSEDGPAAGFVLSLDPNYFERSKKELVHTIAHEMGHVIGLDHSTNSHSVMYPVTDASQTLAPADIAMCKYLKARWDGMSKRDAQQEFKISTG